MALENAVQSAQDSARSALNSVSSRLSSSLASGTGALKLSQDQATKGLGWMVIGLGLGELFMTRALARLAGVDQKYSTVLRVYGAREIVSGVGLLAAKNKKPWYWFRVFGDAIDGAFLGWAFAQEKDSDSRKRIAISAAVVAPVVAMDLYYSLKD